MTTRAGPAGVGALLTDYRNFAGRRLWLLFGLMLAAAFVEGVGILMLVPLATIAIGEGNFPGLPDALSVGGLTSNQRFMLALALFVGAMTLRSALVFARDVRVARLQSGYEASLRLRAATTLAKRGWRFAAGVGQPGMQSLLLTDIPRATQAVAHMQQFAVAFVMLTVQLTLAALLSPALTGVALATLAIGLAVSIGWTRRSVRSGRALVSRAQESAGSGFRLHAGLKSALAQGTVEHFLTEYRASLARAKQDIVRFLTDVASSRALAFFGSAVTAALLFLVGYGPLDLPFPVLVTCLALFARVAAPAQQLQQSAQLIAANAPSFAAIEHRLGPLGEDVHERAAAQPIGWDALELTNLGFDHSPGLGVQGVDLRLNRGEWLGIAGPSGAGKTTVVDLICGLVAPQRGSITVDGQPLSGRLLDRWRAGLAYVGQEGSVFDDSVRGNLAADGSAASEEEMWAALDLVGLGGRIRSLDGGLDERVGDRGSSLSGGERQRLALARALLRRPSLLILDEATSALDADSESAILDGLRAMDPRPATILIAHRPSTLAHCDSTLTIRHGRVGAAQADIPEG